MAGGCEQCIMSAQAQKEQYYSTVKQATDYARQNKTQVAIYKEGFQFSFIAADIAIRDSYPIVEFISQYS